MNQDLLFPVSILGLSVHSIVGLVAIWVGLGRAHWFVRLAVLGGVLCVGLPIAAYDLILLFALQAVVAMVPLWLIRRRLGMGKAGETADAEICRPRRRWLQFSLLDLLMATVVVAAIVAFAVRIPSGVLIGWLFTPDIVDLTPIDVNSGWFDFTTMPAAEWIVLGVPGLALGLSTLVAAWFGLGMDRWWRRCAVVCLVPTSIPMAVWIAALRGAGWTGRGPDTSAPFGGWLRNTPRRRRLVRIGAHLIVLVISLLWLLPTGLVYCMLLHTWPIPQIKLPNPNGYDELTEVADRVESVPVPDVYLATQSELRDFLAEQKETLALTRAAIARESAVPLPSTWAHYNEQSDRMMLHRQLARILCIEGRVAEAEDRDEDAADSYLDCVRLGSTVARGGMIPHWLVGIGIEQTGFSSLSGLRDKLSADRMRGLIEILPSFDANREPLTDVCYRDAIWSWNVGIWQTRLGQLFGPPPGTVRPDYDFFLRRNQAQMRLLVCDLAIRIYRAERGSDPGELADLVPEYLPAVPRDPFSEKPLMYRRTPKGYLLYSVGRNQVDDGGRPTPAAKGWGACNTSGDLVLDPPTGKPGRE
jgi:hypothetical protein